MRTSERILKQKRKLFHVLLAKTKQMASKQFILEGQGVQSTIELTEEQLDALIDWAGNIYDQQQNTADKEIRNWRHKCLRMMAECGVNTNDWAKVNAFMLDKRICGKNLYELKTVDELRNLHRKLHNVAKNKQERILKEQKQAFLN